VNLKHSKLYPKHRLVDLEPHYSAHVSAMTTDELHYKSDIAAQLAWRDKVIAKHNDDVLTILKNVGVDTECGSCMEKAMTGSETGHKHTCKAKKS